MRNAIIALALGVALGVALGAAFTAVVDRAAETNIPAADRAAVQAIIETAKE